MGEVPVGSRGQEATWRSRFGVLLRAFLVAAVVVVAKFLVNRQEWEFVSSIPVLTGLMGGVVFALAILLNGTVRDYKESEQLLARFVSEIRRAWFDIRLVVTPRDARERFRRGLHDVVLVVDDCLHHGRDLQMSRIAPAMAALDHEMETSIDADAAAPLVRTVQVRFGEMQRVLDRMEVIMETTFMRAGYNMAAAVIVLALGGFLFADVGTLEQSLLLNGFAALLLSGLFFLVRDMENPFAGDLRLNSWQVDKLLAWLDQQQTD